MDTTVERDGHCRQAAAATDAVPKFMWICPSELAKNLEKEERRWLVLDTRPYSYYSGKHVDNAVSLYFPPMQMKRLRRGAVSLDSLLTDTTLLDTIKASDRIVLYDNNSTPSETRPDLLKLVEILQGKFEDKLSIRLLLGGMETFLPTYPNLCNSNNPSKALSPTLMILPPVSDVNPGLDTPEGTPVEILPFLYLGSAKDSSDLRILRKMKITAVLNITTSCPNHFESHFEYKSIPVEDSQEADLLSRLQTAISFIDEIKSKGGRVFVHCHAGISRSATVCIAYLMQHKYMSKDAAYHFVQNKRPIISPNLAFMGQLVQYERKLRLLWTTHHMTVTTSTITDTHVTTLTCGSPTKSACFFEESLPSDVETDLCTPLFNSCEAESTVPFRKMSLPVKSRDGMRLSFNDELTRRKSTANTGTNQISPCRVEASQGSLTLSLNLSTTCT